MARAIALISLSFLAGIFSPIMAGTGGPDLYGYVWKDSNEPDVSFNWVEIDGRAGAIQIAGLADDNAVGPFSLGWDFHYYWSDYNSIKIGSNGWLAFSNIGNIASCFPQVPTPAGIGDNIIAPFMSDLTFISNTSTSPNQGEMWYWTNNLDSFVVEWVDVPWWQNNAPDWIGANTFQVIFSGADSSITFQYLKTDAGVFPGGTSCSTNTYLEIGIENVTGDIGLNYSTGTTVPGNNFAVKYIYPTGAAFLVPDATPIWNLNADNAGQFVYSYTSVVLNTTLRNVGNTPITNPIKTIGRVFDLQRVEAWADSLTTNGLVNGLDVNLEFGDTLNLRGPGQYYFEVKATAGGNQDINPTNNDNSIELVAVDNFTGYVSLSYATGFPPSDAVSWAGGNSNDGLGLKIVPPGFPALIDTVNVYIIGDGDSQTPPPVGFTIKIFGLDANGQPDPNNVLHTANVAAANVLEDAWNAVAISPGVSISADGFAVAWFQAGTGLSLGAEEFGPISRRTYEILGGAWAPYRSNESTELLMSVQMAIPVSSTPRMAFNADLDVWPNPGHGQFHVAYTLAKAGKSRISIMNLQGQILYVQENGAQAAGKHSHSLNLGGLSAGMYFLNLEVDGQRSSRKLILN